MSRPWAASVVVDGNPLRALAYSNLLYYDIHYKVGWSTKYHHWPNRSRYSTYLGMGFHHCLLNTCRTCPYNVQAMGSQCSNRWHLGTSFGPPYIQDPCSQDK